MEEAVSILVSHAADVGVLAEERSLDISAQKSTVTLFTPQTEQARFHPAVPLYLSSIPLAWSPEILGVTFNPLFHFHKHVDYIVKKFNPRVDIFYLLCGTRCGQQQETRLDTFKSVIAPLFTYAAPKWFPNTNQA